jgi:Tol biopolymer transport system component
MPLDPGTRLGPYEILSPLGAGGMGEVYRARDTRLGRDVAVKVLPEHLSSSPERRARFEREARSVSSLNHPHICALYDVGREGEIDYLVMELLEGETLAGRLTKGALPIAQVLHLGAQIADALDRAHRAGLVHRDLKPGNVMLTKSGAKLMDFGLAKGAGSASSPSALTASPTVTTPLTAEGTIVGTFQYMAPEQLEGKEADARSDLFALGALVYEMATGRRAFEGKTQASLIAAILKEDPRPIHSVEAMSPPALDLLVRQCLRKDPEERIQSAHDIRLQLEGIAATGAMPGGSTVPAAPGRGRSRERLAWGMAALAALIAIAAVAVPFFRPAPVPPVVFASIPPPDGSTFDTSVLGVAISPDGRTLAYVARGAHGGNVWVRPLDSTTARPLAGTEGADCLFWSPDSRSIGFWAGGNLRRIDATGGQSDVVAPTTGCLGASWGSDGQILYVPDLYLPIMRVPASGGTPAAVTIARPGGPSKRIYSQPTLLPDRRHVLYTVNASWQGSDNSGIFVATIDGKDEKRVLPVLSNARFVEPGYLIYAKDGSLRAQTFDLGRLEVSGEPITLVDGVQYVGIYQSHLFALSASGPIAYIEGRGTLTRQFTWVDRKGTILGTVGKPGNYFSPRLSHDGKRLAYDQSEATTDSGDIWALDLVRGISTRLTFDPRNESAPVWSPDDSRILFFGNSPGHSDLFTVASDGTGKIETILSNGADNLPSDWSMDGKSILAQTTHGGGIDSTDLLIASPADRKAVPWLDTPFNERKARFSPDQRWIAYDSDESGRTEVYVRGFSPPGGKWRISGDGGSAPVWSRDGKELFYISPEWKVMAVAVGAKAPFEGATPVALFTIPGAILRMDTVTQYDVAPDGQRFLMNLETPTQGQRMITLVSNWTSLLKRRH